MLKGPKQTIVTNWYVPNKNTPPNKKQTKQLVVVVAPLPLQLVTVKKLVSKVQIAAAVHAVPDSESCVKTWAKVWAVTWEKNAGNVRVTKTSSPKQNT